MKFLQNQSKKVWELISISILVVQITAVVNLLYGFILFFATRCTVFHSSRWCNTPAPATVDFSTQKEVVDSLSSTLPNLSFHPNLELTLAIGLIFYTFAIGGGFVIASYLKHHKILPKYEFWLHLLSEIVMFSIIAFAAVVAVSFS